MIKKALYFGNPAYLSLCNEQLVIQLPGGEPNKTSRPIEDIGIIVLDHKQITLTQGVIEKLLAHNCALVTCDSRHMPMGLLLPLYGNTTQNERCREQLAASVPLRKQLWQQTVQQKIKNQAHLLKDIYGSEVRNMLCWATDVKSGDPDNLEARAAAYYWKNMFPSIEYFTRNSEGIPPNNLLNYGYAILRAIIARALVISGLLPTLGIHHHNRYNAFCLADDIMEPYRPYVDEIVARIVEEVENCFFLNKEIKAKLLTIPVIDVKINGQRSPLMIAASQTTASLYKCFSGESRKIIYPER
ncbi:MAG: type II CRISPR-associated endonuclease Cas1 [Clostridiales bacterium]|nr:type II CRISPR-associated endonuclease Cas1 [Bacillota bacterium]MCD7838170.1 type II CRISPR-associated endonuclease Cas1 [Clostridiales bacterium]